MFVYLVQTQIYRTAGSLFWGGKDKYCFESILSVGCFVVSDRIVENVCVRIPWRLRCLRWMNGLRPRTSWVVSC